MKINIRNRFLYEGFFASAKFYNSLDIEYRKEHKEHFINELLKVLEEFKNCVNIESIQWDEKNSNIYIIEDLPF